MGAESLDMLDWLALVQHELLLFAGIFFVIGALDEFAVDVMWLWLRLTGRKASLRMDLVSLRHARLEGRAAVFIPAWAEDKVIGHTIAHALACWKHGDLRIYVGCYANDPATVEAAMRGAGGDPRVRIVMHPGPGPTTKADCLNRLYSAMVQDERRSGTAYRMVVLHDAEDMVDPAALALLDRALSSADFIQLPVLPTPQPESRWIGSHYCEEFAEAHGKAMVVRSALATGLPAAGVGCAFARNIMEKMAREDARCVPFADDSLTEDYEMGLRVATLGGRSRFLRVRGEDGQLVATRAYFPARIDHAVQQKSRWVHGIALQGWERLGWQGGVGETWMRLRDRRGPLSALVLACGYLLLVLSGLSLLLVYAGYELHWEPTPFLLTLVALNLASLLWRSVFRFAFTAREYGALEGLRAVLRLPVSNIISIMAGRRALFAYMRTLRGAKPRWEKTAHDTHPVARLDASGLVRLDVPA